MTAMVSVVEVLDVVSSERLVAYNVVIRPTIICINISKYVSDQVSAYNGR